MTSLA
jgi:hypothetical protein